MFTGIIEEVGRMRRISKSGEAMILTVEASRVLEDVKIGDSIAVNGVCLTVIEYDASSFTVDVMPETYRKTALKLLQPGSSVNLERAMPANGRFGGHIVQGHVDTTGRIAARQPDQNAVVFRIEPSDTIGMKYVLRHGSVALDGISLTVSDTDERSFAVSIIPHTLAETALKYKQPGDVVNIEFDLLGKYIENLLRYRADSATGSGGSGERITMDFLSRHGFM